MSLKASRKFSPQHILTEKSTWDVARNASEIALEFALLGYISIATSLFSTTVEFNNACKGAWSPGLYFAWEAADSWPTYIPPEDRTPEALTKLENERILWKRDTHMDEAGLDRLLSVAQGDASGALWGRSSLRPDDFAAALDLALFLGKEDRAREILKTIAKNFHWMFKDVSKSRRAWKLLKDKALAQELGLKDEKVLAFAEEVRRVFQQRIDDGPIRRPYEHKTIAELVKLCDENTIKNACWEETDYDPDNPPNTILRDPAAPEAIAALEKRINHGLPEDYKEFLSISNGLGSWWNGFFGEPEISSTDTVQIMDATEEQNKWTELGVELLRIPNLPICMNWPAFESVFKINNGDSDSEYVWLIGPELVRKARQSLWEAYEKADEAVKGQIDEAIQSTYGSKAASDELEWLVTTWSSRGLELYTYASFREYLEYVVGETAKEDIMGEEDEEGRPLHSHYVFAYSLR
ncbi:hypothetical protein AOQ84DRAFT_136979 [Glonium stellatum]|uniref:Knr4/Smi1-like domain-containing protein n=1 Tax=Glonium stellatum TaxID=574774 RepID=A0A8E2FA38_9PEZI|nr:hypothetical protein AOQ84DRAFT_136979 [Glonium stellatum]